MFSDFDAKAKREAEGRGRRSASLVIAGLLFAGLAALLTIAIATASAVIERRQRDVEVEFAALDEPEAEPEPEPEPPPPPPPRPRARMASVSDRPPDSIPDERPPESEGDLVDGDVGSEWGEEGGTDTSPVRPRPEPVLPAPPGPPEEDRPPPRPPQQERIEISEPRMLSGCQRPDLPEELEAATAETITIYVRMIVGADGRVMSASIEQSHPLIPDETVLSCIQSRIYEPAHLPDGTPVPFPLRYAFTYRPDVL